ncbi:interleukin-6 receptor subunit beta [Grus japonensis]|uniref:Interleukin-6 receptor subunit beta n=1 Tax=Grus japonensis TaxID=30415 RepID=A0ABC9YCB8_GRUJA
MGLNRKPQLPGNPEAIMDWPEGKDFRILPEEVTRAEEAPLYNILPENEKLYALFTDGSCRIVGKHWRWKAAVWSPTRRVAEAAEGEGELSQFAEVKSIQLALDIAEQEKWPMLYRYTHSWIVANTLWGWLQQWKQSNWQHRGKPIWAAPLWQDIAARLEKLVVKVHHIDAHVPKRWATEEHQNNQQVDQAAKIEVAQVDLDWQHKEPSKGPPIWRIIDASRSLDSWTVHLMWKALESGEANGVILQYEVTVRAKSSLSSPPEKYNVNTTNLTLKLPNGTYEITVIAHNRVGASPPSILLIPTSNSKAPVKNIRTLPKDGKLWVGWTAPNNYVLKYVIEWCLVSNSSDCIIEWQNEPRNVQGAYLKGDIKPFKCYLITVYPLYADGQGSGQSLKAYLQQDRPSKGPTVQTKKVGKTEAVLTWNHLTVDEQNGFIRSYTIFYKTVDGNETAVTVDSSKTEYTLSSLTSDTLYTVRMMAYTDEGGRSGPDFMFTTQKFGKGEIEAIVVPACLAFLLIVLLGVLFCFNKCDLIKKHIWPNVPDPSKSNIAKWSPQVPAKHNFSSKDQMYPEGSFTDVSVVEIKADDKKSFSEQDLKPFDFFKKVKSTSEGHSSGIGGSSCMSSPRQSISDSDEGENTQNTSSTVQYSTVVLNGYRDQTPVQVFSRSESTQPLLDSEERSEDHAGGSDSTTQRQQYFKQNCGHDETNTDRPCFERAKQITPANEGDLVGFAQLQISGPSSQPLGLGLEKNTQEATLSDVLQTSTKGQTVRPETVEGNPLSVDEMPKSYLLQTVRQGGYMPQ